MTQPLDAPDDRDRPLLPPQAESGPGLLRWAVAAMALVLVAVLAYQGYAWLTGDVERRRAAAERASDAAPAAAAAAAASAVAVAAASPAGARPPAPAAGPQPGSEPAAPAVIGGGIQKCVQDGQVTYTNEACPEGSAPAVVGASSGVDPNGVVGSAGDSTPAPVPRPTALAGGQDPSQQEAGCTFLTAEITRLDYEFRQPLPPAVLDHISSRLAALRAQAGSAHCALPAKAPDSAASGPARRRAPTRMLEESASR
jgi:hypothetical protein